MIASASSLAWSNTPENITPGEMSRLPSFCPHTQTFDLRGTPDAPTAKQRELLGVMGPTLWAVHHYCWALINMHRADATVGAPALQRHLREWAIADCYYVIRQAPPDFVLLPEIHLRVGELLTILGRPGEAVAQFERSMALKADYWPPYLRLANLNLALNRRQVAIDVLNRGLVHMPDEARLIDALTRLNAKPASRAAAPATTSPQ